MSGHERTPDLRGETREGPGIAINSRNVTASTAGKIVAGCGTAEFRLGARSPIIDKARVAHELLEPFGLAHAPVGNCCLAVWARHRLCRQLRQVYRRGRTTDRRATGDSYDGRLV
jgi:hypothetical protein